jgi:N-alpha-acetyltransferase 40
MGWDPPSKKQELFHPDSRFVLLRRPQPQDNLDPLCGELDIMAYSMFRFDMEDDECVLYWYGRTFKFRLVYWGTLIDQLRAPGVAIGTARRHRKGADAMSM